MKKVFTVLVAALIGLSSLLLNSCSSSGPMSDSPYFGIGDHNKRFVPRELHEVE